MLPRSFVIPDSCLTCQVFFSLHLYPPLRRLDDCLEHWKLCKIDYNDCILETEEETGDRGWKLLPGSRIGECGTQWANVRRKNNGINIGSFCPMDGGGRGELRRARCAPGARCCTDFPWPAIVRCIVDFLIPLQARKDFCTHSRCLVTLRNDYRLPLCAANVLPVIYMIFPFPKAAGCAAECFLASCRLLSDRWPGVSDNVLPFLSISVVSRLPFYCTNLTIVLHSESRRVWMPMPSCDFEIVWTGTQSFCSCRYSIAGCRSIQEAISRSTSYFFLIRTGTCHILGVGNHPKKAAAPPPINTERKIAAKAGKSEWKFDTISGFV
ncbi:uncharacterized protein LOC120321886 [Drosophila yakuba]|uniref:uncharacterized protein LOC120321886 n=1 Tax=Drosophila yakuba TaxID=7245 RepID=UPI00193081B3|nr:uncharacterized protein LOC120321886 [Drosophila yakuba]